MNETPYRPRMPKKHEGILKNYMDEFKEKLNGMTSEQVEVLMRGLLSDTESGTITHKPSDSHINTNLAEQLLNILRGELGIGQSEAPSVYTPKPSTAKGTIHKVRSAPGKLNIILGCMHFPFHNKEMWEAVLSFVEANKDRINAVIFNGDTLDMHNISRHNKGKITIDLTLEDEYEQTKAELIRLNDLLPSDCQKFFFYGNHEMWFHQYMGEVDQYKIGKNIIRPPEEAAGFQSLGYNVQNDYRSAYLTVGDLEIIHGDWVSVHASKKHMDVMKRSVAFNHTHRIGSHMEGDLQAFNLGWGGNKEAPVFGYVTKRQKELWANGFGVAMEDSKGTTHVSQIVWRNGFMFEGVEY